MTAHLDVWKEKDITSEKHGATGALGCYFEHHKRVCLCIDEKDSFFLSITVPGNTGFHMILSGRVKPLTYPYCLKVGQQFDVPCPTPHLESVNDVSEISARLQSLQIDF